MFIASARPQRFGQDYSEFFDGQRIRLFLDSTVVRLEGDRSTNGVTHAVVRNSNGRGLAIGATFLSPPAAASRTPACSSFRNSAVAMVLEMNTISWVAA